MPSSKFLYRPTERQRVVAKACEHAERPPHGQHGFTLVEFMFALTVFTIGLLAVAAMSTIVVRENATSKKLSIATTLAQDKLEALKAMPFNTVASEPTATIPSEPWASRQVQVTPDSPVSGMKKIDVMVTWMNMGAQTGRTHNVALTTLRSE